MMGGTTGATGQLLTGMKQTMSSVKAGLSTMTTAAAAQYEAVTEQAEAALAALEAQYCKPATFTPSAWGRGAALRSHPPLTGV